MQSIEEKQTTKNETLETSEIGEQLEMIYVMYPSRTDLCFFTEIGQQQRDTHRHTDTQTHKHTDTHRHTSTHTHRHTSTHTHRHTNTKTHRRTDTQTHKHTDK